MTASIRTLFGLYGIGKRVGKSEQESATRRRSDQRTGFREIRYGLRTTLDFIKERGSEPRTFRLIVLGGFVQLAAGQSMIGDSLHSRELGPRFTEYVLRGSAGVWAGIHLHVSALSFLSPETGILLQTRFLSQQGQKGETGSRLTYAWRSR